MSATMQPAIGRTGQIPTLAEILSADPDEFVKKYTDIAAINLACALGLPKAEGIDIPRSLAALDAMAIWIKRKTDNSWHLFGRAPIEFQRSKNAFRVHVMLHHVHEHFGVRYNPESMDINDVDWTDSGDEFIHGILSERRTGTCASLPVFAAALGRRLGYPIKLAHAPRHRFFRWDDGQERFNVDYCGHGASITPDEHYETWPIPWDAQMRRIQHEQELWLHSLTPRQEVATCLTSRANVLYHSDRDLPEALACVNAALRFNPKWRTGYELRWRDIRAKLKTVRLLLAILHHRHELEKIQHPEAALKYAIEAAEREPDPIFAGPIYEARRILASAAPPAKPGPPHRARKPEHLQSATAPGIRVPLVAGHRIVLGIPGVLSVGATPAGSPFSAPKAAPRKAKG